MCVFGVPLLCSGGGLLLCGTPVLISRLVLVCGVGLWVFDCGVIVSVCPTRVVGQPSFWFLAFPFQFEIEF